MSRYAQVECAWFSGLMGRPQNMGIIWDLADAAEATWMTLMQRTRPDSGGNNSLLGLTVTDPAVPAAGPQECAAGLREVAEQMVDRKTSQDTSLHIQHGRIGSRICTSRGACSLHAAELRQGLAYVETSQICVLMHDRFRCRSMFDASKQCQSRDRVFRNTSRPSRCLCCPARRFAHADSVTSVQECGGEASARAAIDNLIIQNP